MREHIKEPTQKIKIEHIKKQNKQCAQYHGESAVEESTRSIVREPAQSTCTSPSKLLEGHDMNAM